MAFPIFFLHLGSCRRPQQRTKRRVASSLQPRNGNSPPPAPRRGAKFTARCARSADACNVWRALRARCTPNVENFIARCARAADACNVWRALLACCTPNDWRALRALCRCTYHTSLPSRLRWLGWTRMDTLGNSGPKWQFWSKVTILAQSDNSGPK